MNVNALCFTLRGAEVIKRISSAAPELSINGYYKFSGEKPEGVLPLECSAAEFVQSSFLSGTPLIIIGAAGIAVRLISPYAADKLSDIPVVVIDEAARFVIPLLSGHVGGGNDLALWLSNLLGAEPVITTATDINGCFSANVFARENNLTIKNRAGIKVVASKVLRGEPIVIGVRELPAPAQVDIAISDIRPEGACLWLSHKKYVLGIGCRRGKSCDEIEAAVLSVLNTLGIDFNDIHAFGSIDLKKDESGLLDFSLKHRIPFFTFTAELLMKARGDYSSSDFVMDKTGADNVCERAAVLLTEGNGRLVVKKQIFDGITVAVAERSFI